LSGDGSYQAVRYSIIGRKRFDTLGWILPRVWIAGAAKRGWTAARKIRSLEREVILESLRLIDGVLYWI